MVLMDERIRQVFTHSIESQIALVDLLAPQMEQAAARLVQCLLADGKILLCGNGRSAANVAHFSAALLNASESERPPLPVIALGAEVAALTSTSAESHHDHIFARQIQAIGQSNDVLLMFSTSGNANSLLIALQAAHDKGLDTIILNGRDGGLLASHAGPEDIEIRVPAARTCRIYETHLLIIHCFCELIDMALFGVGMSEES